ncbi:pseudouridine synthase [Bacillus carboniphilus]|uniref:Pseudouridine synthase n=1 Tax=Bacillus carboniphilus TaxID=86663 RepID=A0ABY9JWL6_9BACI|nr:pseudouridine synthase [Bacillus carboniphilus]WLR43781.1 pseudouridine synthase [Bacillus carboniphilus]
MERLQKVIAHAGVASRRKAEQLILEGKVTVNGQVIKELGTKVTNNDRIEVEGVPVNREAPVYFLMYKPKKVISSAKDDKGRRTVVDFFDHIDKRIYPIGRLDYDTSGLLLLTNDGDFSNKLMHPRYGIEKTYIAKVKGIPEREKLKQLERGVRLEDGKTAPARIKIQSIDKKKQTCIIEMVIREGKNRQVRRMLDFIGHPIMKLKRERYAFLTLQGLKPGEIRELSPHEVKQIRALAEHGRNAF